MNDTAYESALRILVRRPHAEGELVQKLKRKEFTQPEIELALEQLREEGRLNDSALAKELVAWHLEYRPLGKNGMRRRLQVRCFSEVDSQVALEEVLTPEAERDALRRLLENRLRRSDLEKLPEQKRRERLARFALSRGFATSDVLDCVNQLLTETHAES